MYSLLEECQFYSGKRICPWLVTETEAARPGDEDSTRQHGGSNWWLPIKWSVGIVRDANLAGRVVNPPVYTVLVKCIADYRYCIL